MANGLSVLTVLFNIIKHGILRSPAAAECLYFLVTSQELRRCGKSSVLKMYKLKEKPNKQNNN